MTSKVQRDTAPKRTLPPNAGKGRKKGVPNKTTAKVKDAIMQAFDMAGGAEYLKKVSQDDPRTFCSLLGRVLPAEIQATLSNPDGGPLEIRWLDK